MAMKISAAVLLALVVLTACSTSGTDQAGRDGVSRTSTTVGDADPTTTDASTTAAAAGDDIACDAVDPAGWRVVPTSTDAADLIRNSTLPPVPGTTMSSDAKTDESTYPTPADFLAQAVLDDPGSRAAVMTRGGYRFGIEAQFDRADQPFTAQSLVFRDAKGAADYATAQLSSLCRYAGPYAQTITATNGVAYEDPVGAEHGIFVIGSEEVNLTLCSCVTGDKLALMRDWYAAWVDQIGTGAPVPLG